MRAVVATAILALTIVATVMIYKLLPSWQVALWVVLGAGLINFAVPMSDLATMVAPAHLAGSVYLVAYILQTYAGLKPGAAVTGAIVLLCLLSVAILKLAPRAADDTDDTDDTEDD